MKREICVPEVPASQMVLTIITDEQLEAFADAVVKKYQQSVQPRSTAGKSPAEEWMTRCQAQAYISINEARGDLIHIKNALKAMPQEERLRCFADPYFMRKWISGANKLIKRWREIERTLTE